MADNSYDMRRKLLELQSELLKNSGDSFAPPSTPSKSAEPQINVTEADDIKAILKELQENQQLILKVLLDIKSRLR